MVEKRILFVDAEVDAREFLALGLRGAGYTVDAVATAAEANRRLDAQFYALGIVDWRLPDGDGAELADRVLGLRAKTLIISGDMFALPAEAADRHETMMKPIKSFALVAAVQRMIRSPT